MSIQISDRALGRIREILGQTGLSEKQFVRIFLKGFT